MSKLLFALGSPGSEMGTLMYACSFIIQRASQNQGFCSLCLTHSVVETLSDGGSLTAVREHVADDSSMTAGAHRPCHQHLARGSVHSGDH